MDPWSRVVLNQVTHSRVASSSYIDAATRAPVADQFVFVETELGCGDGVIETVADRPDRRGGPNPTSHSPQCREVNWLPASKLAKNGS
jgi:hypothetical protein